MVQTSFHLLVVACLLACPFRCAANQAAFLIDGGQTSPACDCCGGSETDRELSTSDRPDQCPVDGCDCGNCICHGAVTPNDGEMSAAIDLDHWVLLTPIENQLLAAMARPVRSSGQLRPVGAYRSGRDVRIAQQSWQI